MIVPRFSRYTGGNPDSSQTSEYYDYFELVISSIIFAYTSLESFANICIPINYKYKEEKAGVEIYYNKDAIERKFALRDKFKYILKELLDTPDPSTQGW